MHLKSIKERKKENLLSEINVATVDFFWLLSAWYSFLMHLLLTPHIPSLTASLSCCKDLRNHPVKPKIKSQEFQFATKFRV